MVIDEAHKFISAALFTSFNAMNKVYADLVKRKLPFPFFRLERSSSNAIENFKNSGNGVLFASGAMWEGIDIPGDVLSMLIIVKLPFAAPDPFGEYEQTLYENADEYKRFVLEADMLISALQAYGRVLRIERDTGVVAFIDCRLGIFGKYRKALLSVLPKSRVTDDIDVVCDFYWECKSPAFFG